MHLTFLHEEHPLSAKVALCVIDSTDYRFLIGRDILDKLQFSLTSEGLTLTNPKTSVTALYENVESSAFAVSSHPLVNTTEPVLKGDIKCKNSSQHAIQMLSCDDQNMEGDSVVAPYSPTTKGDSTAVPPQGRNTKGDSVAAP